LEESLDHIGHVTSGKISRISLWFLAASIICFIGLFVIPLVAAENYYQGFYDVGDFLIWVARICGFVSFPFSLTGFILINKVYNKEKYQLRLPSLIGNFIMCMLSAVLCVFIIYVLLTGEPYMAY